MVEAVLADEIDVGPLDSYALDLMLRHEPDLGQKIRTVATTDIAPIPFLVASADCPDEVVSSLQAALAKYADCSDTAGLRDRLCLEGFVPVAADDYSLTARWDDEARKAGYSQPG